MKRKFKAFLQGFDYGVKHYLTIEDRHFHSYPDADWHEKDINKIYRKGIYAARRYMHYRYEILTLTVLIFTALLFMFTW